MNKSETILDGIGYMNLFLHKYNIKYHKIMQIIEVVIIIFVRSIIYNQILNFLIVLCIFPLKEGDFLLADRLVLLKNIANLIFKSINIKN